MRGHVGDIPGTKRPPHTAQQSLGGSAGEMAWALSQAEIGVSIDRVIGSLEMNPQYTMTLVIWTPKRTHRTSPKSM